MFSKAITLCSLAAGVSAHMMLHYPVPYGKATLNNSPLELSEFPCKQRPGVYEVTEMNQWNAGETKEVSFFGSAVHGGGSCQFSLTTDTQPSTSSQWKVIQSVIGGCPANTPGNLPSGADPNSQGSAKFPVTLPADLPDGQYTFAWSWQNKVGNREFYMNCAPIQVGSGAGTASTQSASKALSTLPDMFVVNLPATECSTSENQDFVYPNPGKNVVYGAGAAQGNTLTGAGCAKQNLLGAGNGQIGSPAPASPAPVASSQPSYAAPSKPSNTAAPKQPAAASPVPSNPGGVFAPVPAPVASAQPTTLIAQPAPSKVPAQTPQQPQAPSNNGSGTYNPQCTPCTNDGGVVCIGTNQFGLCNRGCAVAQDLALGMACKNGAVVGATKRSHFPRAHLHRRHSGSHLF